MPKPSTTLELPPFGMVLPGKPSVERATSTTVPYTHLVGWVSRIIMQMEALGYEVSSPAIHEPHMGRYVDWKDPLDAHAHRFDKRSFAVGFSRGSSALVNWLSENETVELGNVALVSDWEDLRRRYPGSNPYFEIDPGLAERCTSIHIFHGLKDSPEVKKSVGRLLGVLTPTETNNIKYHKLPERNHMLPYDTPEIPGLYQALTGQPVVIE